MLIATTLRALRARLPRYPSGLEAVETLAQLAVEAGLDDAERGRIVAALVREHQEKGGELPQTTLAVAFEPALVRIRWKLKRTSLPDLDQDVLVAFLRAIQLGSAVKADAYAPPAIVKYVARTVSRRDKRTRRDELELEPFEDRSYNREKYDSAERWAIARVEALLAPFEPRLREALFHTLGYEESLKDHVAECIPGLDEKERNRVYEQLRRARTEAIEMLQEQVAQPAKK
jgi:hypothetical protein